MSANPTAIPNSNPNNNGEIFKLLKMLIKHIVFFILFYHVLRFIVYKGPPVQGNGLMGSHMETKENLKRLEALIDYYHTTNVLVEDYVKEGLMMKEHGESLQAKWWEFEALYDKRLDDLRKLRNSGQPIDKNSEIYQHLVYGRYPEIQQGIDYINDKKEELLKIFKEFQKADPIKITMFNELYPKMRENVEIISQKGIPLVGFERFMFEVVEFNIENLKKVTSLITTYYEAEGNHMWLEDFWLFREFPVLERMLNIRLWTFYKDHQFKKLRYEIIPQEIQNRSAQLGSYYPWVEFYIERLRWYQAETYRFMSCMTESVKTWRVDLAKKVNETIVLIQELSHLAGDERKLIPKPYKAQKAEDEGQWSSVYLVNPDGKTLTRMKKGRHFYGNIEINVVQL